jgi:hypothetical protein
VSYRNGNPRISTVKPMKIRNSHPAVSHFVRGRFGEPELPNEVGKVHAVFYVYELGRQTPLIWRFAGRPMKLLAEMTKPEYVEGWPPDEAACGANVRVILPMKFDTDEENVCRRCRELALIWLIDADECIRQIESRRNKRSAG